MIFKYTLNHINLKSFNIISAVKLILKSKCPVRQSAEKMVHLSDIENGRKEILSSDAQTSYKSLEFSTDIVEYLVCVPFVRLARLA